MANSAEAEGDRDTSEEAARPSDDGRQFGDLVPVCLNFELAWASEEERAAIMERMRREGRQTMNLRLMPGARLIRITTKPDADELARGAPADTIVGWGGLVLPSERTPYPEMFSLFVDEAFRTYTLGVMLELARFTYFAKHGFDFVYARMDEASNYELLRYRVDNGLYEGVPPEDLDAAYVGMCKECELYKKECLKQVYFRIDVKRFIAHGEARVGPVDVEHLPLRFLLRRDNIRTRKRGRPKAPYRAYWI